MEFKYILEEMKLIKQGDHMVFLYDDKDVSYNADIISSYIITRIIKNEKCFYISGDIDVELILERLKSSIEIEEAINNGQLVILNKTDAYSKDGKFDPKKMIDLLKKLAFESVQEGYDAVAITGELSWLIEYEDGFKKIMDYEYMLNEEIFGDHPVSAVCRYNMNKFTSQMIKNIIEVHPLIIWKGNIHENPFYFEVVNTEKLDMDKYQVQSMLKTIKNFTNTKSRFHDEIQKKEKEYQELELSLLKNMIVALSGLLEIHDEYTKNHSEKVANISKKIAKAMGFPEEKINQIYYAGLVHDIGKAILPKDILNKKGKLDEEEYEIIKKHSTYGYKALVNAKELSNIANIVLQHHERIDGQGYPLGLKGNDILIESRILAVADSYEAMTSDRPYRKAFTKQVAIDEIMKNIGEQFDEDIAYTAIEEVLEHI